MSKNKKAPALPTNGERRPAPRSSMVGVKMTPDEKQAVEGIAQERGHESAAECMRVAFNVYAALPLSEWRAIVKTLKPAAG